MLRKAATLALLAAAVGCASGGGPVLSGDDSLERAIAERGLDAQRVARPFELSQEALAWLAETFPKAGISPRQRLEALLARMTGDSGLGIRYRRGYTGTANEVFADRDANCLGFMNLFVGFARELELAVYFVSVTGATTFEREGDLIVISDHIAAGFGPPDEMLLLDFTAGPPVKYDRVAPIADVLAIARYHSNRGAELLREGRVGDARRWLELAVGLDPQMASAWVNLGVALRRGGNSQAAEAAYLTALEVDSNLPSAYQNLAALIRLRGDEERALKLLALTRDLGSRNPFNYVSLGDWSLDAGRPDEARRFYRRALGLGRHAEIHAAMGELELAVGNIGRARKQLRRAQRLDPEHPRAFRLERSLATAGSG